MRDGIDLLKLEDATCIAWISQYSKGTGKKAYYLTLVEKASQRRSKTRITQTQAQGGVASIMLHVELLLRERGQRSPGALDVNYPRLKSEVCTSRFRAIPNLGSTPT